MRAAMRGSPALLAAAVLLGAAARAADAPADGGTLTQYVIEQLAVSVAAQPDGSGDHIATLHSGDAVQVIERQEDRAHVRLASGAEGWVRAAYLMAGPPLRLQLQERTHDLDALKQKVAGLESELVQARAHQSEAQVVRPAQEPPGEARAADAPLFSGVGETTFRPGWGLLAAAAVLALGAGFALGWQWLDRRIRRKYGGLRIY